MKQRSKPARPPSRLVPATLGMLVAALAFATLMIRLEVVQEGYRLSTLRDEIGALQEHERALKLQVAELSSQHRLRELAVKYQMSAPARGQVVEVP